MNGKWFGSKKAGVGSGGVGEGGLGSGGMLSNSTVLTISHVCVMSADHSYLHTGLRTNPFPTFMSNHFVL